MLFRLLYKAALCLYGLAYLPHLIMRAKQEPDQGRFLKERLGNFAQDFGGAPWIWIHAVSVGEAMALRKFLENLQARFPEFRILISTTTPTGQKIAQGFKNEKIRVVYFPLDFRSMMKRAIDAVKPRMIVLMETEIWPHLIDLAHERRIPIGIMNGRISERAFKKYRKIKFWMSPICAKLSFCLVRENGDRERFLELGVSVDKIQVTGNMKYDVDAELDAAALREFQTALGLQNELLWTCGSTHDGEEAVLLEVFSKLKEKFPKLKLILAPRHPERALQVLNLAKNAGFQAVLYSRRESAFDVLVVDLVGLLQKFYAVSNLVFVGGSLIPHGGQNPIEPARESKPVLSGRHVHNFEQVFEQLEKSGGAVLVSGSEELYKHALSLLTDLPRTKEMGERAYKTVNGLKGASQRNLQALEPILRSAEKLEVVT